MKNHEEIKRLFTAATTTIEQLTQICNLYRNIYDIYTPEGSQKINQFEDVFNRRHENIVRAINSLTRFVEQSFAPSEEELLREKAMETLRKEHPTFDSWPAEAQNAILIVKLKELSEKKPKQTSDQQHAKREVLQSMNNPELDKPFAITDDLIGCKPYKFELLGKMNNVASWKKLCAEVCTILYNQNPQLLEDYVASPANTNAGNYNIISRHSNFVDKSFKLMTGFYICDGCDATYYRKFTIKFMEIYDIPLQALSIYLNKIAKR